MGKVNKSVVHEMEGVGDVLCIEISRTVTVHPQVSTIESPLISIPSSINGSSRKGCSTGSHLLPLLIHIDDLQHRTPYCSPSSHSFFVFSSTGGKRTLSLSSNPRVVCCRPARAILLCPNSRYSDLGPSTPPPSDTEHSKFDLQTKSGKLTRGGRIEITYLLSA